LTSTAQQDEAAMLAQGAGNLLRCDAFRNREGGRVSETVGDSGDVADSDDEEVELCVGQVVHEVLGENGIIDSIAREDECVSLDEQVPANQVNGISPWVYMTLPAHHPLVREPKACSGRQAHRAYSHRILRGRCVCVCVFDVVVV
jgi:hypothetical protein